MRDRNKIVTNGCTGNCCKAFHLPVTLEDLKRSQTATHAGKFDRWIDERGGDRIQLCPEEIDFIVDMLIPLGENDISQEDNRPLIDWWKGYLERDGVPYRDPTEEDMRRYFNNMKYKDGKIFGNYFTCKHFDVENKVCATYEQRPHFCRSHGARNKCCYSDCKMEPI